MNKRFSFIKNKKQQKGILTALGKIEKILSVKENWIKNAFEVDGSYCLLGATEHVDGPFENDVKRSMVFSLAGKYRSNVQEGEDAIGYDGDIAYFNDAYRRRHTDIVKFLGRVRKNVETAL